MLEPLRGTALEPGTAAGVSRRQFLGAMAAGPAAALLAGRPRVAEARSSVAAIEKAQAEALTDEDFWAQVRGEFLISDELAYMNSGTLGPMPKPVFYAVVDGYRALAADPGRENPRQEEAQDVLREKLAAFVNASPVEIALTRNTTEGMSFIANGLDLEAGGMKCCAPFMSTLAAWSPGRSSRNGTESSSRSYRFRFRPRARRKS